MCLLENGFNIKKIIILLRISQDFSGKIIDRVYPQQIDIMIYCSDSIAAKYNDTI